MKGKGKGREEGGKGGKGREGGEKGGKGRGGEKGGKERGRTPPLLLDKSNPGRDIFCCLMLIGVCLCTVHITDAIRDAHFHEIISW